MINEFAKDGAAFTAALQNVIGFEKAYQGELERTLKAYEIAKKEAETVDARLISEKESFKKALKALQLEMEQAGDLKTGFPAIASVARKILKLRPRALDLLELEAKATRAQLEAVTLAKKPGTDRKQAARNFIQELFRAAGAPVPNFGEEMGGEMDRLRKAAERLETIIEIAKGRGPRVFEPVSFKVSGVSGVLEAFFIFPESTLDRILTIWETAFKNQIISGHLTYNLSDVITYVLLTPRDGRLLSNNDLIRGSLHGEPKAKQKMIKPAVKPAPEPEAGPFFSRADFY